MVHQMKGPVSQELDLSCQPDSHLRTWDQSGTGSVLSARQSPQNMGSVSQSETGSVLSTRQSPQDTGTASQSGTGSVLSTRQSPQDMGTASQSGTGSVLSTGQSPQNMGPVSQSGTGSVLSTGQSPQDTGPDRKGKKSTHSGCIPGGWVHWGCWHQQHTCHTAGLWPVLYSCTGLSHCSWCRCCPLADSCRVHTCQHTGQFHFTDSCRVHTCQHTGQLHFIVTGFTPANIQVSFTL